jgi:hypothetical protein
MRFRRVFLVLALALALGAGVNLSATAHAAPASSIGGGQPPQTQAGPSSSQSSRHGHTPYDNWWVCSPTNPGTQCNNTDPYTTNCAPNNDFFATSENFSYGGSTWQVQLYYSRGCGTVWSRLQLLSGSNGCSSCELEVQVDPGNGPLTVGAQNQYIYSGAYTNQLYIPCSSGGTYTATASIWTWNYGTIAYTLPWYPVC